MDRNASLEQNDTIIGVEYRTLRSHWSSPIPSNTVSIAFRSVTMTRSIGSMRKGSIFCRFSRANIGKYIPIGEHWRLADDNQFDRLIILAFHFAHRRMYCRHSELSFATPEKELKFFLNKTKTSRWKWKDFNCKCNGPPPQRRRIRRKSCQWPQFMALEGAYKRNRASVGA